MATRPQIVFFGSGPVAARCLVLLLQHCDVEAVITKTRPAHHKHDAPVISTAARHDIPVYTASAKAELSRLVTSLHFKSRVGILIDFGIIVKRQTIDAFELGIINSHFSLLPQLRGADPITFAILEGHHKTGVSLMCIDEGLDTGKLITYRSLHLAPHETAPTLTDRLVVLSDELLQKFLPRYLRGDVLPRQQPHPDRATYTRKLTRADGIINWHEPAVLIERKIRAFQPWPRMHTQFGKLNVIITSASVVDTTTGDPSALYISAKSLTVQTGKGQLVINHLQPAGKKEMPIEAFLRGYGNHIN